MVLLSMDVGLVCVSRRVDAQPFWRGRGELTLFYEGVEKSEGTNGLDDGDRAWDDAGVMAATYLERGVLARGEVDAILLYADRWRWLDRTAPDDRGSGGDASEDASGVVRLWHYAFVLVAIRVIIFGSTKGARGKTCAKFDSLYCRDAKCGLRDAVFDAVEHRVANSDGHAVGGAFDDAANGIPFRLGGHDALVHCVRRRLTHAGEGVVENRLALIFREGKWIQRIVSGLLGAKLGDVSDDLNSKAGVESLEGNSSRDAERSCESPGKVSPASNVMVIAITNERWVVCVSRTGNAAKSLVVLAARVGVLDLCAERCPTGASICKA